MTDNRIAVTLSHSAIAMIDRWVAEGRYRDRSHAIQAALAEQVFRCRRLERDAAKLDPAEEKALSEGGVY